MNRNCPVCGTELNTMACSSCGTPMAGADYFVSKETYNLWTGYMEARKVEMKPRSREELMDALHISRNCVAMFDSRKKNVKVLYANGNSELLEHVNQLSLGDAHCIFVMEDGTVKAMGENLYGQCAIDGTPNIAYACAGDINSFLIDRSGHVKVSGSVDANMLVQLKEIRSVRAVAVGSYNCALLNENGTVILIGGYNAPQDLRSDSQVAKAWRNITKLSACADALLGLTEDGRVMYAGNRDGRNAVKDWTDIMDIAIDSHCAVGLMRNGRLNIAYKNDRVAHFDELENMTDVVAIASSRSGIAAVSSSGSLEIVGNIRQIDKIKKSFYESPELRKMFIIRPNG